MVYGNADPSKWFAIIVLAIIAIVVIVIIFASLRTEHFATSTDNEQAEGASSFYEWDVGMGIPHHKRKKKHCHPDHDTCHWDDLSVKQKNEACMNKCDITINKDIDKYVLKSTVKPTPNMSRYALKSELPRAIPRSEYIPKSEIPPCQRHHHRCHKCHRRHRCHERHCGHACRECARCRFHPYPAPYYGGVQPDDGALAEGIDNTEEPFTGYNSRETRHQVNKSIPPLNKFKGCFEKLNGAPFGDGKAVSAKMIFWSEMTQPNYYLDHGQIS